MQSVSLGGLAPWLALLAGYLLGSIPFGLILTRAAGLGDLRRVGSGNIGATNVLRTGSKKLAAATLLLDAAKGAVAVLLAERVAPGTGLVAGLGAFLGHLYPVWLGFRGGKGVATLLGVALAVLPWAALAFALVWLAVAWASRYSSLAGMSAAVATPLTAAALGPPEAAALFAAMAALLLLKHRANIGRLLRGEESRIGGSR